MALENKLGVENEKNVCVISLDKNDNKDEVPNELEPFIWTTKLRVILVIMAVAQFSNTVCYSQIAPFFPLEAKNKELHPTQTGMVFSSYELVAFIMSPIWGRVLPRLGMKFTFVGGLVGASVNVVMFGFLEWIPNGMPFFLLSLTSRCISGFFASAFATSSYAISAHLFRAKQNTVVGILGCSSSIGFAIGPVIGAVLYDAAGFALPFCIFGPLMLTVACTAFFVLPTFKEQTPSAEQNDKEKRPTSFRLLCIPTISIQYICICSVPICFTFVEPTLQSHLANLGVRMSEVGIFFCILAVSSMASSPVWGIFADRRPQYATYMQIFASLTAAIGLLLTGPSPILPLHQIPLLTIGIGLSILGFSLSAIRVPAFDKCIVTAIRNGYTSNVALFGTVSGLFQSAFSLGGFAGPLLGVALTENFGFDWSVTFIAGFTTFVAFLLAVNKFLVQ